MDACTYKQVHILRGYEVQLRRLDPELGQYAHMV